MEILIHGSNRITIQFLQLRVAERKEINLCAPIAYRTAYCRMIRTFKKTSIVQFRNRHIGKINTVIRIHRKRIAEWFRLSGSNIFLPRHADLQNTHIQKIFVKTGERLIRIFSCPDHQPAAVLHPVLNRLNILIAKGRNIKPVNDQIV